MDRHPLTILSLFAGSRSVDKAALEVDHDPFSVDSIQHGDIDLVADIGNLSPFLLPPCPDVIFATPPCTSYSRVGYRHHREKGTGRPLTEAAWKGERLVLRTLSLIRYFSKINPRLIYYIENPEGHLAKSKIHTEDLPGLLMGGIPMTKVTYCSYGYRFMKPTNIWTNNLYSLVNNAGWSPKEPCFRSNPGCHHEKDGRSKEDIKARGGVKCGGWSRYSKKTELDRSRIPHELCRDMIVAAERTLENCNG